MSLRHRKLKRIRHDRKTRGVKRVVKFKCEVCGWKGEEEDPRPMQPVMCPECDAYYFHFPDGQWKCVVRPYFAKGC